MSTESHSDRLRELQAELGITGREPTKNIGRGLYVLAEYAQDHDAEWMFQRRELDANLLALVAILGQDGGVNGADVREAAGLLFKTRPSPGTIYPALKSLHEDGPLDKRRAVRSKFYSIDDAESARHQLAKARRRHLAQAAFLKQAIASLGANPAETGPYLDP